MQTDLKRIKFVISSVNKMPETSRLRLFCLGCNQNAYLFQTKLKKKKSLLDGSHRARGVSNRWGEERAPQNRRASLTFGLSSLHGERSTFERDKKKKKREKKESEKILTACAETAKTWHLNWAGSQTISRELLKYSCREWTVDYLIIPHLALRRST